MEQYSEAKQAIIDLAVKQIETRDPRSPVKVADGRIWRLLGEGESAEWIQFVFIEELYPTHDGIYARGYRV